MGRFGDGFKLLHGGVGIVTDVISAGHHIATLNPHGLLTDGQKFVGDVGDFLKGSTVLFRGMVNVAKGYAERLIPKALNSPPLDAAQLLIEGMKATTGHGNPVDGTEFQKGGKLFDKAVEVLVDAKPIADRWDGAASTTYGETNDEHRRRVSGMSVSDVSVGGILNREATQINATRKTLDDWSQFLYDFGLTTSLLLLLGPEMEPLKLTLDIGAAAVGSAATGFAMDKMAVDALQNAWELRGLIEDYQNAANEKIPEDSACAPFGEDNHKRGSLPTRTQDDQYTPPEPEPFQYGPPARPYGLPNQTPEPGPATPTSPPAPAPSTPPVTPPVAPSAPAPAASTPPATAVPASPVHSTPSAPAPVVTSPTPAPAVVPTVSTAAPSPVLGGPNAAPVGATRTPVASGPAASPTVAPSVAPTAGQSGAQAGAGVRPVLNNSGRAPVDIAPDFHPNPAAVQPGRTATR